MAAAAGRVSCDTLIGVWVLLGSLGSCAIANATEGTPKAWWVMAIGAFVGHEMGHGFDDQGIIYDSQGWMRNWWSDEALKRFHARTQALVEQYDAFSPYPGVNVNGKLTLGENLGDLSGVEASYAAYKKYTAKHGEPPVINGLVESLQGLLRNGMKRPSMRQEVVTILGNIGPRSEPAVPQLIELLQTKVPDSTCEAAATALGKIGKEAKGAVDHLILLLANGRTSRIVRSSILVAPPCERVLPKFSVLVVL